MKKSKIFALAAMGLVSVALCTVAVGQDHATPQDVVAKVRDAASILSKTVTWHSFSRSRVRGCGQTLISSSRTAQRKP